MVARRKIEVFTAGCPLCLETVNLVKDLACPSCEVIVYDLVKQCETKECIDKVRRYGINSVPTVVVDGKIAQCCLRPKPDKKALLAAGIGRPL
ncbi:MAG TPA: thioredoxin family protein [Candidatus Hypogeohydataceae bacterium YC38]